MTVGNFVRIVWTVFEKIEKSRKMIVFLAILGVILAMLLTSQSYDFDAIAQKLLLIWRRMTVENFLRMVWRVL